MPRANSSVPRHKKHRKIIKRAKGYYGVRKSNYRAAKDAVEKSLLYSYRDRSSHLKEFKPTNNSYDFKFNLIEDEFIKKHGI